MNFLNFLKQKVSVGVSIGSILGAIGAIPFFGIIFYPGAYSASVIGSFFYDIFRGSGALQWVTFVLNIFLWMFIGHVIEKFFKRGNADVVSEVEGFSKLDPEKKDSVREVSSLLVKEYVKTRGIDRGVALALALLMTAFSFTFKSLIFSHLAYASKWAAVFLVINNPFYFLPTGDGFGPLVAVSQRTPIIFILWFLVFYGLLRMKFLYGSFGERIPAIRFVLSVGVLLLVLLPPMFLASASSAKKTEWCLANSEADIDTCLNYAFFDGGKTTVSKLLDFCAGLPGTQGMNAKMKGLHSYQSLTISSSEIFPREYCAFHLRKYVTPSIERSESEHLSEDFQKNFLPRDFDMPGGLSTVHDKQFLALRQSEKEILCGELGKRTGLGETKNRCLSYFESEEAQWKSQNPEAFREPEESLESANLPIETALSRESSEQELIYRQRTDPQYYAPVAEMVNRAREDLVKRLQVDVSVVEVAHVEEILLSNSDRNTAEKLQPILLQGIEGRVGDISFPDKSTLRMGASTGVPAYFSFLVSGSSPNVMLFGYQFSSKGEGLLTVYANGVPIYSLDERRYASKYKRIIILPVSSGVQNFSVRLDSFNSTSSIVNVSALSVGNYQDIDLSGSESLGYRVDFKKDKIIYSAYIDPTGFKFIHN